MMHSETIPSHQDAHLESTSLRVVGIGYDVVREEGRRRTHFEMESVNNTYFMSSGNKGNELCTKQSVHTLFRAMPQGKAATRPRIRGQLCRRGEYKVVCLPPAASLLDGPVSHNLQLFLCDKIAPEF